MLKIISSIMLILLLMSCSLVTDVNFEVKASGHELYYGDYGFENFTDISIWIIENMKYVADDDKDVWSNPKDTIQRGYGDCDDYSLLYINFAYTELGITMDLILVDHDNQKTIVSGGSVDHAIVYYNGTLIEPRTGCIVEYDEIGYIYKFEEIFN